jgi:hypothetical protein
VIEAMVREQLGRDESDEQLAREALLEITAASDVGAVTSREQADDGVVTLTFAATMAGYPGWHWTVSLAEVEGLDPTVLELELLPGDGALLAPEWVPWSARLEDYRAAQAGDDAEAAGESDDEDDAADDDDDLDDDLGDDPDDGIDFESADAEPGALSDPALLDDDADDSGLPDVDVSPSGLPDVDVDEQHEPDAEPDEDGPEPPPIVRRQQRRKKQQ